MAKNNLPPSGMRDFLPAEKALREYVFRQIRKVYARHGFSEIETSQIENLDNMENSDGGDNTKLLFKILKRGDKLKLGQVAHKESDLADLALRFDLTLPLSRFYANNRNELPTIFKAIQIGNVFRAERAQKGRYRSFVQCDVDIIGDETNLAEIELINTVCNTLNTLDLTNLTLKINDRRILKAYVMAAGFAEENFTDIAISLDKYDKIGAEGVEKELLKKNYPKEAIAKLAELSTEIESKGLEAFKELSPEAYDNLNTILAVISKVQETVNIQFDHRLVRGMGYYTSTIFEVYYGDGAMAVGGGGRYDNMIGKLSGSDVPAVGFSIGYERIIDILLAENKTSPKETKLALFYQADDDVAEVLQQSTILRQSYDIVSLFLKKKKFGKQVDRLKTEHFDAFTIFGEEIEIKDLEY